MCNVPIRLGRAKDGLSAQPQPKPGALKSGKARPRLPGTKHSLPANFFPSVNTIIKEYEQIHYRAFVLHTPKPSSRETGYDLQRCAAQLSRVG